MERNENVQRIGRLLRWMPRKRAIFTCRTSDALMARREWTNFQDESSNRGDKPERERKFREGEGEQEVKKEE